MSDAADVGTGRENGVGTHDVEAADPLARYRAGFELGPGRHLNNAGVAPMCRPAAEAIAYEAARMASGGSHAMNSTLKRYEASRAVLGTLVGAESEDISMMQTCASAISQVAFGIGLREGDEVVRPDQEYPSNAYPWHVAAKQAGAHVVVVPSGDKLRVDTDAIIEAMTPRTRVVTVSWVEFSTGEIFDLPKLAQACLARSAWLVVDAIQGIGIVPFNLRWSGADVICGGTHKWLAGPVGHGFLACKPGRRDQLTPLMHGAITYGTPDEPVDVEREPRRDPRRFEPGNPLVLGAAGLRGAVEHTLAAGVPTLSAAALALADRLVEGVRQKGGELISRTEPGPNGQRSPITTFVPPGDLDDVERRMRAERIALARRGGGIRIAPHAFNTEDDIDAVIDCF